MDVANPLCKAVSPIHAEQVQQNLSYRHESPTMLSTSNDIKSTNQVAVSVMGENEVVPELNETRSEDQIAVSIILDDGQIVPVGKDALNTAEITKTAENEIQMKRVVSTAMSLEEANDILRKHEQENNLHYATYFCTKGFGNTDFYEKKHKVYWNDADTPFTGIPFTIVGHKSLDCEYGMNRNTTRLKSVIEKKDTPLHRRGCRPTKKHECPAKVVMKEVVEFHDVKIKGDSKWQKNYGSTKLRTRLKEKSVESYCRKIVIAIPEVSVHKYHPVPELKVPKPNASDSKQSKRKLLNPNSIPKKRKVKKKNATDSVLTTLDPGMEEYLNPVVHLAIASQDNKILQAVRQGFKNVFGHTAAKGHNGQHSLAKLPIGFEAGIRAAGEQLDSISTIDFRFSQPYIHVAFQPFLTELQQGSWSCMFCMVVRDSSKQIQLNSFSQPISLPSACVSIAFSKTPQDDVQKKFGFSISIDEAVRLYEPYKADQDWCSTLSGIRLDALIAMASQGLASDYKRELDNPAMQNVESFVVMS